MSKFRKHSIEEKRKRSKLRKKRKKAAKKGLGNRSQPSSSEETLKRTVDLNPGEGISAKQSKGIGREH